MSIDRKLFPRFLTGKILFLSSIFTLFFCLSALLDDYKIIILSNLLIICLYSVSYNILFGAGGMVSFGQAAFFGLGAYVPAILITKYQFAPLLAFMIGPFAAALVAFMLSFAVVRLSSVYFSMVTLAISQIFYTTLVSWYDFTNGDQGIRGLVDIEEYPSIQEMYTIVLLVVVASLMIIWRIEKSSFGTVVLCIRDNKKRVQFLGINKNLILQILYSISGFFSATAGALSAFQQNAADPTMMSFSKSIEPILSSLLGGAHNFYGPILGSGLYKFLEELTSKFSSEHWPLVVGVILILLTIYWPRGFVGMLQDPRWLKWCWRFVNEILSAVSKTIWWLKGMSRK